MLEKMASRILVKDAVQRAMFCPRCQGILDVRRAVLMDVEVSGKTVFMAVECGKCYDGEAKAQLEAGVKAVEAKRPDADVNVTIYDGRVL